MKQTAILTESADQYRLAYSAHYTDRDLPLALQRYQSLMRAHPDTQEAAYSQSQIQNIVNTVVPRQELLNAQIVLANDHFAQDAP